MSDPFRHFGEINLIDFEFRQPDGELPEVHCLVARELRTGRIQRWWADQLSEMSEPVFDLGPTSLLVAYFSTAELNCFRALGWTMPARLLDLFVEFRRHTNGFRLPQGRSLPAALSFFGLRGMDVVEKIKSVKTTTKDGQQDVPVDPVEIIAAVEVK